MIDNVYDSPWCKHKASHHVANISHVDACDWLEKSSISGICQCRAVCKKAHRAAWTALSLMLWLSPAHMSTVTACHQGHIVARYRCQFYQAGLQYLYHHWLTSPPGCHTQLVENASLCVTAHMIAQAALKHVDSVSCCKDRSAECTSVV